MLLVKLFHQQHLPRALDGAGEATLVGRGQAGVFARQNTALIGDVFAEQLDVLGVEVGEVEIHLGFGAGGAALAAAAALVGFVVFAWHKVI